MTREQYILRTLTDAYNRNAKTCMLLKESDPVGNSYLPYRWAASEIFGIIHDAYDEDCGFKFVKSVEAYPEGVYTWNKIEVK